MEIKFGKLLIFSFVLSLTISSVSAQQAPSSEKRVIAFGTTLDPVKAVSGAQQLAKSLANTTSSQWQAKGDQKRTYRFADANKDEPYRICVPTNWDGKSKLPLMMYLHGSGSNESSYLDMNNKQMITLAAQHGFLLVSPMGDQGAYGNFLRLTSPFGDPVNAAKAMSEVTTASERANQLSEQDVLNVLELILNEYPIDRNAMFLSGHSMGSGGTWLIGGKYQDYWRAIAPMSGPFVQETGYPWESMRSMPVFITEGTQAPSLNASRLLRDWMIKQNMKIKYKEVNADHGGMIQPTLPDVFAFFDSCRMATVPVSSKRLVNSYDYLAAYFVNSKTLKISIPPHLRSSGAVITIHNLDGRKRFSGTISTVSSQVSVNNIQLPSGTYNVWITTGTRKQSAMIIVNR